MKVTVQAKGGRVDVKENLVDRVITYLSPVRGQQRFVSRVQMALSGGYIGGSKKRRSLSTFNPLGNSANADILPELQTLRSRTRDLARNTPLAAGAVNTVVTSVVGPGLKLKAEIDRNVLDLDEDAATEWELKAERLWNMWAGKNECDATRTQTFAELQGMVFRGVLESGDIFVLFPTIERSGSHFRTRLQTIEADMVENEDFVADSEKLAGGVEMDEYGAPIRYHILKKHPGDWDYTSKEWRKVRAYGERSGRRLVLHLYDKTRPGQTRGVPYLAPVIEALKQLGEYTDSELMAAVISGLFTVFIHSDNGSNILSDVNTKGETGASASDDDMKLGNGLVVGLKDGEEISTANPGRPNATFDPFVESILRQVGSALEIPFELLIKHFSASYSASRAALLEAWRFFRRRRGWLVNSFCQPVYEEFITEQIAMGRLDAPGFFEDPVIRHAYLGTAWRGLPQGHIQPAQEATAMRTRTEIGVTTLAQETAEYSGADWERNHKQSVKEAAARKEDGLTSSANAAVAPLPQTLDEMKDNE